MPYTGTLAGTVFLLPAGGQATLLAPYPFVDSLASSSRLWTAALEFPGGVDSYLVQYGRPIRYGYVTQSWPIEMYQTVFANEPGSAEMPSAGRPFTPELVTTLVSRGVEIAPLDGGGVGRRSRVVADQLGGVAPVRRVEGIRVAVFGSGQVLEVALVVAAIRLDGKGLPQQLLLAAAGIRAAFAEQAATAARGHHDLAVVRCDLEPRFAYREGLLCLRAREVHRGELLAGALRERVASDGPSQHVDRSHGEGWPPKLNLPRMGGSPCIWSAVRTVRLHCPMGSSCRYGR